MTKKDFTTAMVETIQDRFNAIVQDLEDVSDGIGVELEDGSIFFLTIESEDEV